MKSTNNIQLFFFAKKARLLLLFLVLGLNSWATDYYSQATGNWNSSATWGTVACGNATNAGTFPQAGDVVYICNGHTITCTADAACSSITFTAAAGTVTVNTTITLTVSGALTLNSVNNVTQACTISGLGTISCGSVAVGINLGANTGNVTTTMTSSISTFNCNGNLTITSSKPGTKTNNATLTVSSGTLTVTGTLTTSNTGASTSAFTLGNTSPVLILSGATPWSLSGTGSNTITLNGTGSTVNYSYAGAQAVSAAAYNNLEISGSGVKTMGGAITFTAAGILTVRKNCELANGGNNITTSAAANSLVLENSNTFPGGIISGAGNLVLGSNVTVSTSVSGTASAGATISCPLDLNGATRTFTVADDGSSVADLLITGVVSNNTGAITKSGAGSLSLSGVNTFRSGVIINAGTLIAKNASALGNVGFSTLTLNGGTLDLQIDASINAYPTTVGGSATIISNKATAASAGITHTLGTLSIGAFTLTIDGGSNVTSGTAGITFGNVTHTAAPIYTVNDPSGGGTTQLSIGTVGAANFLGTFNGSGDVIQTGVYGTNTVGVTYNGTGTLTLNRANTFSGVLTVSSGTVIATSLATALGAGTLTLSGGTLKLTNATATPLNFGRNTTVSASSTIVTDVTAAGSGNIYTLGTLSINASTLTIAGGTNVNAGTAGITFGAVTHTGAPTYTVNDPSAGVTQLSIGAVGNADFLTTFNGSGDIIQTGAMGTNSAGITYSGTGTLTLNQANLYTGPTSISSGKIVLGSTTALGTSSAITVSSGAVLDLNGFTLSTARPLTLNGTGISSGGALINSGAAVNYTGAITLGSASSISTTGNITLTTNGITGTQNLTKIGAGTLNFGSGTVTLAGLIITAGTLTSTSGNLSMTGNFENGGTYTHNSGTAIFNGTALQTIGTNSTDFYNLTINNSSAAGVTMSGPATVANTLTLTDGIINSDATNFITMKAGSTVSPDGGTATEFVDGPIAKEGTTAFIFPIGDGAKWSRAAIGIPTLSSTFKAQYFATAYTNTNVSDIDITSVPILRRISRKEYWTIDRTVGTGNATLTLYWQDSVFSGIRNCVEDYLKIAHWNSVSSKWENNNPLVSYSCGLSGSITTSGNVTSFSPFTFGSQAEVWQINPLPIELLSFNAKSNGDKVDVIWTTASEINNDYFTIERTVDGINYEVVGTVKGNGNSTSVINYVSEDNIPYNGVSYYRLKQTDFDGKVSYSDLKMVSFENDQDLSFMIYPNPNDGSVFYLKTYGNTNNVLVVVRDVLGNEMYSNEFISDEVNDHVQVIEPSQKLKPGVYFISATTKDKIYNKRLIVN